METETLTESKAENFEEGTGTKFKSKFLKHGLHFPEDKEERDVCSITLKNWRGSWTFRFGQSIAREGTLPVAYDVLAALQKHDAGTFEDFCNEYGYSEDSRKAEKTYKAVAKEWENVQRMFSSEEIEELQEIS